MTDTHIKGLRLYLPPFAPDTSGAASVAFPTGGLSVIIDAGGCAGNICGFDEPRWQTDTSAVMSAGLRDMDAIMGRDDRLLDKIERALSQIAATHITLISTPVPAVIGTDLHALRRLLTRRCGLPVAIAASDGTHAYDQGASQAYLGLLEALLEPDTAKLPASVGIWGTTPLDITRPDADQLRHQLRISGCQHVFLHGLDHGAEPYKAAAAVERNIVIAPSGLAPARYLQQHYHIPFTVCHPLAAQQLETMLATTTDALPATGQRVLILHQQMAANAMRQAIRQRLGHEAPQINCATFFAQDETYCEPGDAKFTEEYEFPEWVAENAPDLIIADKIYQRALPSWHGIFLDYPHFAVSGER